MEERNLTINLQEAREWYKGTIKELRDLALKTFSKNELDPPKWQNIKTWQDVLDVLGITKDNTEVLPFKACYAARVQMIREALNKGYDMSLWKGTIWYPYFRIGSEDNVKRHSDFVCGNIVVEESQPGSDSRFLLVGGNASDGGSAGLGVFFSNFGVGLSNSTCGPLGCATKEIAEHFGKYFYFEILASWYGNKISK